MPSWFPYELLPYDLSVLDVQRYTNYIWLALLTFWLGTWVFIKRPAFRPSVDVRLEHSTVVAAGLFLLFGHFAPPVPLNMQLYRVTIPLAFAGTLVVAAGVALAIWARIILGSNWSAAAEIKDQHELIKSGPYRFMRHPIYEGFVVALAGSAIQRGSLCAALGVAVCFWGLQMKIEVEERLLTHRFGEQYLAYQRTVSALPPFLP
ncbi:MAG TPA: isoprenylcysteine carboxylmethyltransferase family protein [Terriglobales bacterium]|nr:isoprenylcysteine carboxylmethyltransferase family protein [Terriglobales bacterium]